MSVLQYLCRLSLSPIPPQIRGLAWACEVLHWPFSVLIQKACLIHSARLLRITTMYLRSDKGERKEMVAALDTITNCQRKAQHCAVPLLPAADPKRRLQPVSDLKVWHHCKMEIIFGRLTGWKKNGCFRVRNLQRISSKLWVICWRYVARLTLEEPLLFLPADF